jgi:hypothetical protein
MGPSREAETRAFLRDFWLSDRAPARPALMLCAPYEPAPGPADPDPVRAEQARLQDRPDLGDDYVPMFGTSNGTSAMVSACGSVVEAEGGIRWAHKLLGDIREADDLPLPSVEAGLVGEALARTRVLVEHGELPIQSLDLQSPLTVATQLLGVSELYLAMYDEPRRVHALLELLTEFFIRVVEAQRGIAGQRYAPVFWPGIWSPPELGLELCDDYMLTLSPEVFDEFSLPCLTRLAEHFGGLFLHSCSIYRRNLPSIAKLPHLRGINSDLSMSCPVREMLDALPGVVVAPHVYMNKEITRPSQAAWLADTLATWRPGDRLFPYVLAVLYDPEAKGEQATDWEAVKAAVAG